MDKYYLNCVTGEITESREKAMKWYREDDVSVEIWKNGKWILTLNPMGI